MTTAKFLPKLCVPWEVWPFEAWINQIYLSIFIPPFPYRFRGVSRTYYINSPWPWPQPVPPTLSCKSPGLAEIWKFLFLNATEDDADECFAIFWQGAPGLSRGNSKAVTEIAQFLSSWSSLLDVWSCDGVPFPSLIPKPTNAKDWNELQIVKTFKIYVLVKLRLQHCRS